MLALKQHLKMCVCASVLVNMIDIGDGEKHALKEIGQIGQRGVVLSDWIQIF